MAGLGLIGSLHEENSKYKIINVKIHLANVQYCYNISNFAPPLKNFIDILSFRHK